MTPNKQRLALDPVEPYVGIKFSRGHMALVSKSDALRIRGKRWYRQSYTRKDGTENVYANCRVGDRGVGMHRFILGLTWRDKIFVDHINGNGLDNRRENLRLASHAENMRNRRPDRRLRRIAEQQLSAQAGPTPVFFDALRASDGAVQEISPVEVWESIPRIKKAPKPRRVRPLLSAGELAVVQGLSDGCEMTEIAARVGVTVKTVSTAKKRASKKLGVRNSTNPVALVDQARKCGLVGRQR